MLNRKVNLGSLAFFCVLIFSSVIFVSSIARINIQLSFLVLSLFFIIGTIALINLSFETNSLGYSINSMHWMFVFIFMFLAPITQYTTESYPLKLVAKEEELLLSNIVIIIWCIAYIFGHNYSIKYIKNKHSRLNFYYIIDNKAIVFCFIVSTFIFIYSISQIGFSNILSRYTYTKSLSSIGGNIYFLVFNTFLRAFVLFSLSLSIIRYRNNIKLAGSIMLFVQGIYVIILYFPVGSGRFWAFMVYVGLLIQFVVKFRWKQMIKAITFFGLLYLMPLFNAFRYSAFGEANFGNIFSSDVVSSFIQGDYDAYSMILRTLRYTEENAITYGKQLLGGILFFVPRSIWPGKPIGSGAFVGSYQGLDFLNISSPLIAEGLINFGIIGVIAYAFLFGIIVNRIDSVASFYLQNSTDKRISILKLIYPYLIGFSFLLLRGDFMTGFSNLIGFLLPAFIIMILVKIFNSRSDYSHQAKVSNEK